jgi:antitoxin HicB
MGEPVLSHYKSVDEYLMLPYTIQIVRGGSIGSSGWFAKVVELPGCMTQADHFDDLDEMVTDAMRSWIEAAIKDNALVPEPRPHDEYSGKFIVRIPKSLHRELSHEAERDGVSLNTHIVAMLAKPVGKQSSNTAVKN